MLHEPAGNVEKDHATPYKTVIGVRMFVVYALVYLGFVAINVFKPALMETTVLLGLNLAVVYGFGLIILALVLALIYNLMCVKREKQVNSQGREGEIS